MIHSIQSLTFDLKTYHLFTMCGLKTIVVPNAHGVCLETYDVMESHDTTHVCSNPQTSDSLDRAYSKFSCYFMVRKIFLVFKYLLTPKFSYSYRVVIHCLRSWTPQQMFVLIFLLALFSDIYFYIPECHQFLSKHFLDFYVHGIIFRLSNWSD